MRKTMPPKYQVGGHRIVSLDIQVKYVVLPVIVSGISLACDCEEVSFCIPYVE
jgi:hypothetical protein